MSQTDAIRYHLLHVGPLTPIEALERYHCFRLAARIKELRREGLDVETEIVKGEGKRWARYRVAGPVQREMFNGY